MTLNPADRSYALVALLAASAAASFLDTLYNYFAPNNGIDHTPGALLVVISTALILGASTAELAAAGMPLWIRRTLDVLLILGIVGTGLAAYFLEANILLVLMLLAPIAWLGQVAIGPLSRRQRFVTPEASR